MPDAANPSEPNPHVEPLMDAVRAAASSSSTNPWGSTKRALGVFVGGHAGVIGVQDSTVIDRAIGSPGMLSKADVHGFVVKQPDPPKRAATMNEVAAEVRKAIEEQPFITTAILFDHGQAYAPSHILCTGTAAGALLHSCFPNATYETDLVKNASRAARVWTGPWHVVVSSIERGSDGSVSLLATDEAEDSRGLHPGDVLVIASAESPSIAIGLGTISHYTRRSDECCRIVLERFKAIEPENAASHGESHLLALEENS